MIIYGTKAVHLKTTKFPRATCTSCNTQGSLNFSIYSRHAHIFWIPVFPYGKKGFSQCEHCKQELKLKEMPESYKREYDKLKDEVRTPIWQFSGLVLLISLFGWVAVSAENDKTNALEYIAAPAVGDVYEFKTEEGDYSTMKVARVDADSVYVLQNNYAIGKKTRMYKIDKEENYATETYGISRAEIQQMHTNKIIFDVNR